jgi:hypothetical protein
MSGVGALVCDEFPADTMSLNGASACTIPVTFGFKRIQGGYTQDNFVYAIPNGVNQLRLDAFEAMREQDNGGLRGYISICGRGHESSSSGRQISRRSHELGCNA